MNKFLLVVGTGGQRELGIKTLIKRKDFTPILIDSYKNNGLTSFFNGTIFVKDFNNYQSIFNEILLKVPTKGIVGVVTFVEHLVPLSVWLAQKLNLGSMLYEDSFNARNKLCMRNKINNEKESRINQPNFQYIKDYNDLLIGEIISFPGVVKPLDMAGSIGVKRINSYKELRESLKAIPNYNNKGYLFEEYIKGKEFSAEGFVQDYETTIICFTEKDVDDSDNYFVEVGHFLPYKFGTSISSSIGENIREIIRILRLNNCTFHLEFKITEDNKFYFIEIGARPAGGYMCDMIYKSLKINLYDILIDVSIGKRVNLTKSNDERFSGIRYFTGDIPIDLSNKGIEVVNINTQFRQKGKSKVKSNADLTGFVQIVGDDEKEVKNSLKRVAKV
ncbi:ATP-grasp domain-containing protein [Virgibacillus doumboii]|uniref:ATP-grasp domain-containing protein n=1 Tax=Virgibacillus doumboii TaxID=2697503 RepID=UPI0013DF587B|nr:ATP-grasp domain-containing protein [Virgibacillus doumboii]